MFVCYTKVAMFKVQPPAPRTQQKLFNKSFYKFAFSFVEVVAVVLLFILVLGVSGDAVQ